MTTLLLRFAGPMQSWGTQSHFKVRDTDREPSKSGVIGLLCAALGRPRDATLEDLVTLRMGVRVDREGILRVDYQTAGGVHRRGDHYGVAKASGATPETVDSRRYYLADADFLVGLEGDDALLRALNAAVRAPVWPLYLGRKSFVPAVPVHLPDGPPLGPGLRAHGLEEALRTYDWPLAPSSAEGRRQLRLVLDAPTGLGGEVRLDVPLSFEPEDRRFTARHVVTTWIEAPEADA